MEVDYAKVCGGVPVIEAPGDNLKTPVERFVATKEWLDRMARSWAARPLIAATGLQTGYYGTVNPFTYAFDLLPFYERSRSANMKQERRGYKALVPTEIVIGESWDWRPEDISEEKQAKVIAASLTDFVNSEEHTPRGACASYTYIRSLGVVLAHEGKNRVALFREKDLPYIPAMVHEEDYPPAENIRIFDLPGACVAVLENRWVEKVHSLPLIQDLMESYGVKIEKKWPAEYPSLDAVIDGFRDCRFYDQIYGARVDMCAVARDESILDEEVETSLQSIGSVLLPHWSTFLALGLLSLLCLSCAAMLVPDPSIRTVIAMVLVGLGVAASILMYVPMMSVFGCKVRDLNEGERWRHLHAGRRRIEAAADWERNQRSV